MKRWDKGRNDERLTKRTRYQEQIKVLDKEYRLVLDKLEEVSIRCQGLSDVRQKLVQGHQIVRPSV